MRFGKIRVGVQEITILLVLMGVMWFLSPAKAENQDYSWAQLKQIEDTNTIPYHIVEHVSRGGSTIPVVVTAYTCGPESTGKYPGSPNFCRTASGHILSNADTFKAVAADTDYYPIGTRLYLEGIGIVTVVDTGGDIQGPNRIDLFVSVMDTSPAYKWGVKRLNMRRL